jgi:dCMP deaminase
MKRDQDWWDHWFLGMAEYTSTASKDPSTKTGAVIVDPDRRIVSLGYNGLPMGIEDTAERLNNRELKYQMIVHCERNAIIFAQRSVEYCTLYTWPFLSCSVCAAMVIQAGIIRCVAPKLPEHLKERWGDALDLSMSMFEEADVEVKLI